METQVGIRVWYARKRAKTIQRGGLAHSKKLPLIISQVAETNSPAPCSDGRRMAGPPQASGASATRGLGRGDRQGEGATADESRRLSLQLVSGRVLREGGEDGTLETFTVPCY